MKHEVEDQPGCRRVGARCSAPRRRRAPPSTPTSCRRRRSRASVAVPRQECVNGEQVVQPQPSGAGALIGAIAGGVIGNQFGHGFGRAAATGVGAVAGSAIGNNVEANANPPTDRAGATLPHRQRATRTASSATTSSTSTTASATRRACRTIRARAWRSTCGRPSDAPLDRVGPPASYGAVPPSSSYGAVPRTSKPPPAYSEAPPIVRRRAHGYYAPAPRVVLRAGSGVLPARLTTSRRQRSASASATGSATRGIAATAAATAVALSRRLARRSSRLALTLARSPH